MLRDCEGRDQNVGLRHLVYHAGAHLRNAFGTRIPQPRRCRGPYLRLGGFVQMRHLLPVN
jgi:hypothetical protein